MEQLTSGEQDAVAAPATLPSEEIVVSAPMSFHGSAVRIWRLTDGAQETWARVALGALAVLMIAIAWTVILCWYLIFGLLLVPYRLIRRSQRKRKLEDARHRELLTAMQLKQSPPD